MEDTETRSIWTPANVVTCARVALVPVWLALAEGARMTGGPVLGWATFVLYVVVALTDKLDGHLARSRGEVTTFGKFLDPIADKLAVTVALLCLLERSLVPSWAVLAIVAREFLVSGLRMVVATSGTVIAASALGKWKTATTMVALCLLLYAIVPGAPGAAAMLALGTACLYVGVALTAWSGIDYFAKSWPAVTGHDE